MSEQVWKRCQVRVYPTSGTFNGYPCSNSAKVEREGKHYCGIHDPVKIKERRDKRYADYMVKRAAQHERYRRADLFPKMLAAAEAVLEWQRRLYEEQAARTGNVTSFRKWLGEGSLGKLADAAAKAKGESDE